MLLWHFIFICVGNVAPWASTFLVPEKWPYKTPCEISRDLSNGSGSVITSLGKQLPGWQAVFLWRIGTTPRHIYCAAGSTKKEPLYTQDPSTKRFKRPLIYFNTDTHLCMYTNKEQNAMGEKIWSVLAYNVILCRYVRFGAQTRDAPETRLCHELWVRCEWTLTQTLVHIFKQLFHMIFPTG